MALKSSHSSLTKLRIYLHLVPVFGVVFSLWSLYGERSGEEGIPHTGGSEATEATTLHSASQMSVLLGLGCISAIALLGAGASAQASHINHLRFLLTSSFVGSGYFLLSLMLMFRVAKGQSIRLPGLTPLSRRLP